MGPAKVEASVESKELVCLFDQRCNGCIDKYIIESTSFRGEGFEFIGGNIQTVDIVQFHSVVCGVFDGVESSGTVYKFLVNPCHNDLAGATIAVNNIVNGAEAHRSYASKQCERASFDNPHFVFIAAGCGVVVGVKRTDNTRERFSEGTEIECLSFKGE